MSKNKTSTTTTQICNMHAWTIFEFEQIGVMHLLIQTIEIRLSAFRCNAFAVVGAFSLFYFQFVHWSVDRRIFQSKYLTIRCIACIRKYDIRPLITMNNDDSLKLDLESVSVKRCASLKVKPIFEMGASVRVQNPDSKSAVRKIECVRPIPNCW